MAHGKKLDSEPEARMAHPPDLPTCKPTAGFNGLATERRQLAEHDHYLNGAAAITQGIRNQVAKNLADPCRITYTSDGLADDFDLTNFFLIPDLQHLCDLGSKIHQNSDDNQGSRFGFGCNQKIIHDIGEVCTLFSYRADHLCALGAG